VTAAAHHGPPLATRPRPGPRHCRSTSTDIATCCRRLAWALTLGEDEPSCCRESPLDGVPLTMTGALTLPLSGGGCTTTGVRLHPRATQRLYPPVRSSGLLERPGGCTCARRTSHREPSPTGSATLQLPLHRHRELSPATRSASGPCAWTFFPSRKRPVLSTSGIHGRSNARCQPRLEAGATQERRL